jgi:hypothetical protein
MRIDCSGPSSAAAACGASHLLAPLRVSRDGKEVLNKHYAGEGSAGIAWAGTAQSYAQSLGLELASAVKQFVSELDNNLTAP